MFAFICFPVSFFVGHEMKKTFFSDDYDMNAKKRVGFVQGLICLILIPSVVYPIFLQSEPIKRNQINSFLISLKHLDDMTHQGMLIFDRKSEFLG